MIIHVANLICDSVFKYLIEDERIAKTILSALLKKEVIHEEVSLPFLIKMLHIAA